MLSVAVLAFGGLNRAASAQTAPQLLPYTARLIAGGGTQTVGLVAGGAIQTATCPVSGNKPTDNYGDGCLATEIEIGNTASGGTTPGARYAVADAAGNVFFTDYNNALVRRVDAVTGVVTLVAGGALTNPGTATACGTALSIDAIGDGCLGTAVKLTHPEALAFSPAGDLYFTDVTQGQVRKIAATGGLIATTGTITLVAGNVGGTYGYFVSNATTTVVAATQSYLRAPYGIAFDKLGDLFIVDEYNEAILAVNTNATGTNTVNGVAVAAGTIWKVAGSTSLGTVTYCTNATTAPYGCTYNIYTENTPANGDEFDSTYSVAVGTDGTIYAGDEYYDSIFKVTPGGVLSTFAGVQNSAATKYTNVRGIAGATTVKIGSPFGVAADANNNVYFGDASSGFIWRVDQPSETQFVLAGGAATVCSAAIDTYGDGCPATQAKFGYSGSGSYATATLPGPGIYGVTVDAFGNVFTGDTETNLVREIATGAQFGNVGAGTTDILDIHFAAGDAPSATGTYTLTSGATNFLLGTAACTVNTDNNPSVGNTTDCLLPVTATPTATGPFSGTLTVMSNLGRTTAFPLSGNYIQSPNTRTVLTASTAATCSGSAIYSTTSSFALVATITANGPSAPGGTVTFLSNGVAIPLGTGIMVKNIGTTSSPIYAATFLTTFPTAGTYTITAMYSGDTYFKASTTNSPVTVTTALPGLTASVSPYQQGGTVANPVVAGQTALYAINLVQKVYSGTITFSCSGLPAKSSCQFNPATITGTGCSVNSVVAVSVLTTPNLPATAAGLGGAGRGRLQALSILAGLGMALLIGIRRRKLGMRYGQLWMAVALLLAASGAMACNAGTAASTGTPSGSYSLTVTAAGSDGTIIPLTLTLVVK